MAYRRSRRIYRGRRMGRKFMKRRASLRRIKKDIMKCNFPTKIKFMNLPEKKTMFISTTTQLNAKTSVIQLNPFRCVNIKSLFHPQRMTRIVDKKEESYVCMMPNFDKMCVLAIYVKLTPNKNMWNGIAPVVGETTNPNGYGSLAPIECFYSLNNVDDPDTYDKMARDLKQTFTFNCNENFTIYIHKPSTMEVGNGLIHKPGTWYSLGEYQLPDNIIPRQLVEDDDEYSEDDCMLGSVIDNPNANKASMNCGRLTFLSDQTMNYTVTVSYKIALRG